MTDKVGVCKTRGDSSDGLDAENYEFIDVIRPKSSAPTRYVVDKDFVGEFEIVRETKSNNMLRCSLPWGFRVFIGKCKDVKRIVRPMCDEAKQSMKINDLTLPLWNKNRYMLAKWLGLYRRTTNNHLPTMTVSFSVASICTISHPSGCRKWDPSLRSFWVDEIDGILALKRERERD